MCFEVGAGPCHYEERLELSHEPRLSLASTRDQQDSTTSLGGSWTTVLLKRLVDVMTCSTMYTMKRARQCIKQASVYLQYSPRTELRAPFPFLVRGKIAQMALPYLLVLALVLYLSRLLHSPSLQKELFEKCLAGWVPGWLVWIRQGKF